MYLKNYKSENLSLEELRKKYPTKDIVEVHCYYEDEFVERENAKKFYLEGMMCSEGSENARYSKIYCELCDNCLHCSDEWED